MVNKAIAQIVWNKKAKIKYRTMVGPKEQGGLNMPDFQITNEALKVVWVRRSSNSNGTVSWSHIPLSYLQPVGGLFLIRCNFDLRLVKVDIPIIFTKKLCMPGKTLIAVLLLIQKSRHSLEQPSHKDRRLFHLLQKMACRIN